MAQSSRVSASGQEVRQHTLPEVGAALWPLVAPYRGRLILGCASIGLSGAAFGLMPLFSKYLLDVAILERKSLRVAVVVALAFVLFQTLRQCCWFFAQWQFMFIQERATFALRARGFGHVQKLCLRFHSLHPTGFLYQRVFGSAIGAVGGAMQTVVKNLSLYVTGILTSVACCLYLSVPMTLAVLAGTVLYVMCSRVLSRRIYQKARASQEAQNLITEFIMDRLRGTKTVQALSLEEHVQEDFESRLWPAQLKNMAVTRESHLLMLSTEQLGYWLTAVVWVMGAWSVLGSELTLGELVAFMGYQATFITLVATLANINGDIANARAGLDQLLTVLETRSSVPSVPDNGNGPFVPARGDLAFRNVTFRYGSGNDVFSGLDLHVPHGQSVALVGRSGSGKTTFANLLVRFYDPDSGAIELDGQDIRQIPLKQYRQLFGVVLQDPYLFDETVATNLRYANPEASDDELVEALRQAQAWSFVEQLPGRLNYRVGESGGQLSGGQKQRLAIARCLLLRSRFVILDEPTAALDVESERAIQQAFDQLFANRTVFIIAHRLSTIRRANRILVLDKGRIVQDGTYSQLIDEEGLFRQFHQIAMDPGDMLSARLHQG